MAAARVFERTEKLICSTINVLRKQRIKPDKGKILCYICKNSTRDELEVEKCFEKLERDGVIYVKNRKTGPSYYVNNDAQLSSTTIESPTVQMPTATTNSKCINNLSEIFSAESHFMENNSNESKNVLTPPAPDNIKYLYELITIHSISASHKISQFFTGSTITLKWPNFSSGICLRNTYAYILRPVKVGLKNNI